MGSLYIVREFTNDLQCVVQLPNNCQQQLWMEVQGSSSCSVPRGKQARNSDSVFLLPKSLYRSPAEGGAQIKAVVLQQRVWPRLKVCTTAPLIPDDFELRDLLVFLFVCLGFCLFVLDMLFSRQSFSV